jgi:leucyl aminopeptidase
MAHLSKIKHSSGDWQKIKSHAVAVGIYDDLKISRQFQGVNRELGRGLSNMLAANLIKGKSGEVKTVVGKKGAIAFIFGLGNRGELNAETLRKAGGGVSKACNANKINSVSFLVPVDAKDDYMSQAAAEGLVLGSYQFNEFKTTDDDPFEMKDATIVGGNKKAVEKGTIIANGVCLARNVENRPGNIATPSHLAENAKAIGKAGGMKVTVFDREKFTKMGMGALAGVASGTEVPPKFIIMEYMGGPKKQKPKVLVGKGLTFDSGGISIKPAAKMDEMKYDMCGSGVVLGVMKAVSELKPKMNIIGIIPSTENMSGDKAYRPGDVLTAYNGKTIEVLNTDAEGRLILADALSYSSKHYDPEYMIDFATLTGAVVVALGHVATGIMGTDEALVGAIKSSSKTTGEKVWEFPLWDEYLEQVKSKIADVKNVGAPMQAGSIAGGAFLEAFVGEDIPWCHFDIAGTAWGDKDLPYQNKGTATGEVIRLVVDLLGI